VGVVDGTVIRIVPAMTAGGGPSTAENLDGEELPQDLGPENSGSYGVLRVHSLGGLSVNDARHFLEVLDSAYEGLAMFEVLLVADPDRIVASRLHFEGRARAERVRLTSVGSLSCFPGSDLSLRLLNYTRPDSGIYWGSSTPLRFCEST
jgi:hypothetical protein